MTLLVGLLLICFSVAATGASATSDGIQTWYPALNKPPWTPPNWSFGPIWTFLYASMAVAIWDVIRKNDWNDALVPAIVFMAQLALNALWSPVFFALRDTSTGLAVISLLWVMIAVCIYFYRPASRLGMWLMVPYLIWVSVAWSLNAWIVLFN